MLLRLSRRKNRVEAISGDVIRVGKGEGCRATFAECNLTNDRRQVATAITYFNGYVNCQNRVRFKGHARVSRVMVTLLNGGLFNSVEIAILKRIYCRNMNFNVRAFGIFMVKGTRNVRYFPEGNCQEGSIRPIIGGGPTFLINAMARFVSFVNQARRDVRVVGRGKTLYDPNYDANFHTIGLYNSKVPKVCGVTRGTMIVPTFPDVGICGIFRAGEKFDRGEVPFCGRPFSGSVCFSFLWFSDPIYEGSVCLNVSSS